jgi:hypothetical protein
VAVGIVVVRDGAETLRALEHFSLFLFSTSAAWVRAATAAGVDGFVIDWEKVGKERRQAGWDTQINRDTLEDLRRVRQATAATVICRVNPFSESTAGEIEAALGAGAAEILLPMVREPREVEGALKLLSGRGGLGILVETLAAVRHAAELATFPLARVYVGLNDLAIERRTPNIFHALADGVVEQIRPHFSVPFGMAGLTLADCGAPIPCRLLLGEMARLECSFSFLRRSFHRDIQGRDLAAELPRLRAALAAAARRGPQEIAADRSELLAAIAAACFP